jgi:hypothetical protein
VSKAFRLTVTPWHQRKLWRSGSRTYRRLWGLYISWGSREGVNHTACRHHRLGPFVLHVYQVKP